MSGVIHTKLWHRDRRDWLIVRSPYDAGYVSLIKTAIPMSFRMWSPIFKGWLVDAAFANDLHQVLVGCFGADFACPTCAANTGCRYWADFDTCAEEFTRTAAPPPPKAKKKSPRRKKRSASQGSSSWTPPSWSPPPSSPYVDADGEVRQEWFSHGGRDFPSEEATRLLGVPWPCDLLTESGRSKSTPTEAAILS